MHRSSVATIVSDPSRSREVVLFIMFDNMNNKTKNKLTVGLMVAVAILVYASVAFPTLHAMNPKKREAEQSRQPPK
jgi:hypothetical protein